MASDRSAGRASSTDRRSLIGGLTATVVGTGAGRVLQLLTFIVLARTLGAPAFGVFVLGWTLVMMLAVIAPLGLEHGVVRYASPVWARDRGAAGGVVRRGMAIALAGGLAVGGLLVVGAPWLAQAFGSPDLVWTVRGLAVGVVGIPIMRIAGAASRITGRIHPSLVGESFALPAVTVVFVLVVVVGMGAGLRGAVGASAASLVLVAVAVTLMTRHTFPTGRPSGVRSRELLTFSGTAAGAAALSLASVHLGRLILGSVRGDADVGVYVAAGQLALALAMMLPAFNLITAPMAAELYATGALDRLRSVVRVSTKLGIAIALPAVIVALLMPGSVMRSLFGAEFAAGAVPLLVLTVGQMINVGTGQVGSLLLMCGRERAWLKVTLVAFVLALVAGVPLSRAFGASGAAFATSLVLASTYVTSLILVRRFVGIWPYDRGTLRLILAAVPAVGGVILARSTLLATSAAGLVAIVGISYLLFAATAWFVALDGSDRARVGTVVGRMWRRAGASASDTPAVIATRRGAEFHDG